MHIVHNWKIDGKKRRKNVEVATKDRWITFCEQRKLSTDYPQLFTFVHSGWDELILSTRMMKLEC